MAGHAQLKFVMTECSKTQIRLTGLIFFQFEDFSLSSPGQWIEIRDGNSREAPLIGRYTGDKMYEVIISSGPSLHVHLQTDIHSRARGFNFTYQNGKKCFFLSVKVDEPQKELIEPRYDKTNKISVRPAKTQIRLGIRPV